MSDRLRIALITDLFPPIVGGAETHARDLSAALMAAGAKVTVLTRRAAEDLATSETLASGVEVRRIGSPGSPRWGKYRFIPDLLREWRQVESEFDVAYLCGFRVLGWPLAGATARSRVPLVLRAEVLGELSGGFIWDAPGGGRNRLLKILFGPLIALRNRRLIREGRFLAISSAVREEYERAGVPAERMTVIPNGIDTKRFRPPEEEERRSLRMEFSFPGAPVFLYSGKLNRGKGLPALLEAWQRYRCADGAGILVLVGSGGGQYLSEEASLKQTVERNGLGESVRFVGYRDDVEKWLRAADVFVFPSEAESFGLAPLEANASGLPVVCTPAGALAETVPDGVGGIRVPVGDPVELCEAMRTLAASPELRKTLGEAGRQRVLREYSFEAVARRHLSWFETLVYVGGRS